MGSAMASVPIQPHGTCIGVPRIGWGYSTVRSIVSEPANSPSPKSNPSTTV